VATKAQRHKETQRDVGNSCFNQEMLLFSSMSSLKVANRSLK
jgi:hypothetical protein